MGGFTSTELILLGLLQTIVFMVVTIIVLIIKNRGLKRRLLSSPKASATTSDNTSPAGNDASLVDYLKSEAAKTSKQLDYIRDNQPDTDVSGLKLRQELLNFEIAYMEVGQGADSPQDETNWSEVNMKVYKILKASGFSRDMNHLKRALSEDVEETLVPSESLIEQQSKTIKHLKEFINGLLSSMDETALPNEELNQHFSELEQTKIELEQCVVILEDENAFLRDQISALLKIHAGGD